MKCLCISDSHLGCKKYSLNWYPKEMFHNFKYLLERGLDENVDIILFMGDMFDVPHVSSDIIVDTIRLLKSINKPFICINGNHDIAPKRPMDESPLSILDETIDNFILLYKNKRLSTKFRDLNIIGIPYIDAYQFTEHKQPEKLLEPYINLYDPQCYNIAMIHQDLSDLEYTKYFPYTLPASILSDNFEYTFVGHHHDRVQVRDNVMIVGSTYQTSVSQTPDKGAYIFDVDSHELTFIPNDPEHRIKYDVVHYNDIHTLDVESYSEFHLVKVLVICDDENQLLDASLYGKKLRKLISNDIKFLYDYKINQKQQTHTSSQFDNVPVNDDSLIPAYIDYMSKKYDPDFIYKVISVFEQFNVKYKSESKNIDIIMNEVLYNMILEE